MYERFYVYPLYSLALIRKKRPLVMVITRTRDPKPMIVEFTFYFKLGYIYIFNFFFKKKKILRLFFVKIASNYLDYMYKRSWPVHNSDLAT